MRQKKMVAILMVVIMALSLTACGDTLVNEISADESSSVELPQFKTDTMMEETEPVGYEALGIKEYTYPSQFIMGDNLKTAITQLALSYKNFGKDSVQKYELTVNLIKNPYSCFDGYSVVSVSSRNVTPNIEQDDFVHVFYGTDMMVENDGVFAFEFMHSEDTLPYGHFVYVDMTKLPELADFVRQNAGSDFKVMFMLGGEETDTIERVVPVDVILGE